MPKMGGISDRMRPDCVVTLEPGTRLPRDDDALAFSRWIACFGCDTVASADDHWSVSRSLMSFDACGRLPWLGTQRQQEEQLKDDRVG